MTDDDRLNLMKKNAVTVSRAALNTARHMIADANWLKENGALTDAEYRKMLSISESYAMLIHRYQDDLDRRWPGFSAIRRLGFEKGA